uniref:Uncharacterized protein n=1 Tax=Ursus maritimus TaxID=29073 RepID=A0A452UJX0_URSMA
MRSGRGTCYNCSRETTKPSTPDLTIGTKMEKTLGPTFSAVTTIAKTNRTSMHKQHHSVFPSPSTTTYFPRDEEDSVMPDTVLGQCTLCPHPR